MPAKPVIWFIIRACIVPRRHAVRAQKTKFAAAIYREDKQHDGDKPAAQAPRETGASLSR